jgi:serine/threonine-protein kinase
VSLVTVTRSGGVAPFDTAWTATVAGNSGIGLSPDGTRLALSVTDSASGNVDLYVIRLATGLATRLTFDGLTNIRPVWSTDGSRILYGSSAGGTQGLWTRRADGSGRPTRITLPETRPVFEGLWSPDGQWIVYRTDDVSQGNGDIYAVRTSGDSTPVTIVATTAEETGPAISPDGRWVAYASNATGRKEIYVRPFPNAADGMWQVSSDGGAEAEWSHAGNELFYRNANGDIIAVPVTGTPTFAPGAHKTLFNTRDYMANDDSHDYAVTPDDTRFILLRFNEETPGDRSGRLVLVRNWMGRN